MDLENFFDILTYDPVTGDIYTKKTGRKYFVDDNGTVLVYCKGKSYRYMYDKVAYILAYGVIPRKNQKVLHRNLDKTDNRKCNLLLVSRSDYSKVIEAYRNISATIRIVPHTEDQYSYIVYWEDANIYRKKVCSDLISARKLELKLKLKYSKILTKFCIFD